MKTVGLHLPPCPPFTGASLTLRLFPRMGSDVVNGADGNTLRESTPGCFVANVDEALAGVHRADVLNGSALVFQGYVDMSDAAPLIGE